MMDKYEKIDFVSRISPISAWYAKNSLLILGPRGSGKSSFIRELLSSFESVFTIDLLLTDQYQKYLIDPSRLRKEIDQKLKNQKSLHVFIDEVQKIPALLDEVHHLIEKYQGRCLFLLTGSSARKLKKTHANLLAGRALYFPFFFISHGRDRFSGKLRKDSSVWNTAKSFYDK